MKRRIIAAATALVLATLGGLLLMAYVSGADQRAMAGMRTVTVLVVTKPVASGTTSDQLATFVETRTIPVMAVSDGTVTSLDQIAGQVATSSLQPGEQLLVSRFASPASLEDASLVKVPKGMQQVSVLLDSQRVLGGSLHAHDTVGVFISLKPDSQPPQTHLVLNSVLVSKVEGGTAAAAPTDDGQAASAAGKDSVLITLVVSAADAEKVVFGSEHGTVWLSLVNAQSTFANTQVVTPGSVYK